MGARALKLGLLDLVVLAWPAWWEVGRWEGARMGGRGPGSRCGDREAGRRPHGDALTHTHTRALVTHARTQSSKCAKKRQQRGVAEKTKHIGRGDVLIEVPIAADEGRDPTAEEELVVVDPEHEGPRKFH